MKVLIFYTPRSRSTILAHVIAKKFCLPLLSDTLTLSRIKNQNFQEYPSIIDEINNTKTGCIKVCANDFVDLGTCSLSDYYKDIDFSSFTHVITMHRENFLDALLSYAYMDPKDQSSWHSTYNKPARPKSYIVDLAKIKYLQRGYFVFNHLTPYILEASSKAKHFSYTYDSALLGLYNDWQININDVNVDLTPSNLHYHALAENIKDVIASCNKSSELFKSATIDDFNCPTSFVWQ